MKRKLGLNLNSRAERWLYLQQVDDGDVRQHPPVVHACQSALRISIAACVPDRSCEATSSSSRSVAATETHVSTSFLPVPWLGQTMPKMQAHR